MPAKNKIKQYLENGYYHLYNRGVEKRVIYADQQDYLVFLSYLEEYLSPRDHNKLSQVLSSPTTTTKEKDTALKLLRLNNLSDQIELLAFCLMPNHFHLLVKQHSSRAIETLMRSLATRYVRYFNHRHQNRVGHLFQDTYKAVPVTAENQLLHLSRYIHRNPYSAEIALSDSLQPSSYKNYLRVINQSWVKPDEILNYFTSQDLNSYQSFVEDRPGYSAAMEMIAEVTIDP